MSGSASRLRRRGAVVAIIVVAGLGSLATSVFAFTPTAPSFTNFPVDANLAGGEPFVSFVPTAAGGSPNLAYTSHEGTTHLFKDGVVQPSTVCNPNNAPQNSAAGFACSYDNQVNIGRPADHGATWQPTCVASKVAIPDARAT